MSSNRTPSRALLFALAFVVTLLPLVGAARAAPYAPVPREAPGNAAFLRTWERTDRPVGNGSTARTWMWGPQAFTGLLTEAYAESPNGLREVQYFDKARMEITHPDAADDGLWYVTNGLLVVELTSGRMQVGDDTFVDRAPAQVNVAGDADDPTGPTYATFAGMLDAPARDDGALIDQRLSRAGDVSDDPALDVHNVTSAYLVQVPGIDHQVASPFWDFMNSSGTIYRDDAYSEDQLFVNPFYATGYPVSEAYWAAVKVAGTYRDVLMQCFERRCLTYTPGNPPGFLTEAGNVGQHYHSWRYAQPADSLVINEVMYAPDPESAADLAWVELFNPTPQDRDLTGAFLTNADGSHLLGLPAWVLPAGGFLVVYFGDGADDADLSDGAGSLYGGAATTGFLAAGQDAVALYSSTPGSDTIVDFISWSGTGSAAGGVAAEDAVAAGIWTAGAFYDAIEGPLSDPAMDDYALRVPVLPGESIGRNSVGSDSDSPSDFAPFGGPDAVTSTPGAANQNSLGDFITSSDELIAARGRQAGRGPRGPQPQPQPAQQGKKPWTILVFFDGRDGGLYGAWLKDINRMESEGSDANVNIVVEMIAATGSGGKLQANRYFLQKDGNDVQVQKPVETINDQAKLNPGDPAVLTDFIDWTEQHYPASHYAIVLAGHGQGWKGTMLAGEHLDRLTMSEVDTALSALNSGKFESLVWYSCLMGQTEVAYQMQKRAKYMVASEEITISATIPWAALIKQLKSNLGWSAREFSDTLALKWADVLEKELKWRDYTMASIDLDKVRPTLATKIDDFSRQVLSDIDTIINTRDKLDDNAQILIKKGAREKAEQFHDKNFIDTYHFAELVKGLGLPSSAKAQPVMDAVLNSTTVIRHGSGHPHASGLSIYFPHDALQPRDSSKWDRAFDDPLHDPYDKKIPTEGTHYYKRDAALLVPKLRALEYPFKDDPNFDFPSGTGWDEMLHRYYKPVADACIRTGAGCVKEVTVPVGTKVTLSGNGSSDSDGREGASNDEPAHTTSGPEHYYWDFDPAVDHPAPKPNYLDGVRYIGCGADPSPKKDVDQDDCDRDDIDEVDDDIDAQGKLVDFTCPDEKEYPIRMMVWDEHHDEARSRIENKAVNKGRHWLQFNVDDDTVLVKCVKEKKSDPERVPPDSKMQYVIQVVPNVGLTGPADGAVSDTLPDLVEIDGPVTCGSGECSYDATTRTVHWNGTLQPGTVVEIRIPVTLKPKQPNGPELPPSFVNCASVYDGVTAHQACTTTSIGEPIAHLEMETTVATITPGQPFDWSLRLTVGSGLLEAVDASLVDALPAGVTLGGEVACSSGECGWDEQTRTVSWAGELAPGGEVIVTIPALLPEGQTDYPDDITNCADFRAGTASGQTCVTTPLSASVPTPEPTKSATPETVVPGGTIHYTIEIPYRGDGSAAEATMTDALPSMLQFSSDVLCSIGDCGVDPELGTVSWTGTLSPGETAVIEFDALWPPSTEEPPAAIENCADYTYAGGQGRICTTTVVVVTTNLTAS